MSEREAIAHDHFLLITAREGSHGGIDAGGLDGKCANHFRALLQVAGTRGEKRLALQTELWKYDVREDGVGEEKTLVLPVARDQENAVANGMRLCAESYWLAMKPSLPPPGHDTRRARDRRSSL